MSDAIYKPGLEGVIAGETAIGSVQQDGLYYRGYDVKGRPAHRSHRCPRRQRL